MIHATHLITRIYALVVRLYPRSFRVEFEDEMRAVFANSVADAAQRGGLSLLVVSGQAETNLDSIPYLCYNNT